MDLERGHAVVKIFTDELAIVGKILVTETDHRKGRLSDYLNRTDVQFIQVHEAHIFSLETKKSITSNTFILLNKNQINWVVPVKEPEKGGTEIREREFVFT